MRSLQTSEATASSEGNCKLDKRNVEAQPANLGCKVQQAPEHEEEETQSESYPALSNSAKDDSNIPEFISDDGTQTTKAAVANKGNCNFDKTKIEARSTNLGSNQAIRRSPRVLHPEFQQAPEHEETCDKSYLAFFNVAENDGNILEFECDNGKQNTKAVATSKRNCNFDKRTIDAQLTNLGSTWATRWSFKVLYPKVRQASQHEEETWDESFLAFPHCVKEDGSIIEFTFDNGKQIRYEEDDETNEEFVTMKLSKDQITIDSKHFADDRGSSSGTVFRKKLMGILKMPYDVKEHEDLSRRVRHKRQKTVDKNLANKLKLVQGDHHRNLNLLR
ncbi:hypothetical protein BT93_A2289 [Corymbia citriodora subsp. variegata]|nr:hypothetical protein BT93_A2289 [Corymbia citriodora subsp. variegata]